MSRRSKEVKVGELIDKWLRTFNLDGRMKEMNIISNWEQIVGKTIARRTDEVKIKNRQLIVTLKSSVMRDEMLLAKSTILEKVNTFAGETLVDDVFLK